MKILIGLCTLFLFGCLCSAQSTADVKLQIYRFNQEITATQAEIGNLLQTRAKVEATHDGKVQKHNTAIQQAVEKPGLPSNSTETLMSLPPNSSEGVHLQGAFTKLCRLRECISKACL
jgi:hypothetical protein